MQQTKFNEIPSDWLKSTVSHETSRPLICIQGLGFVGSAMSVAVANSRTPTGEPSFNVIGVDLDNEQGRKRVKAINEGRFDMPSTDPKMAKAILEAKNAGNLIASVDPSAYSLADVIVIDIHLDLETDSNHKPTVDFTNLKKAVRTVAMQAKVGALILVETTVPPGTCQFVIAPEIAAALKERGMKKGDIHLAHSYERVMPGKDYFDSMVNFWRVYAADDEASARHCENFISQIVNTTKYPLTRLGSMRASETAKVLENSYRAVNIAFMQEWGNFAESIGIDMFEIVDAIRMRPTHSNIRQPGFGVGGYCLTKDPLFASVAANNFFKLGEAEFPFCQQAVTVNQNMPIGHLDTLQNALGGTLKGKQILVLGVSYRPDVADTRFSPSETFMKEVATRGAKVLAHDPLLDFFPELNLPLPKEIPSASGIDAVVFAVPHQMYCELDVVSWLGMARPIVMDANRVLSSLQKTELKFAGVKVISVGCGELT